MSDNQEQGSQHKTEEDEQEDLRVSIIGHFPQDKAIEGHLQFIDLVQYIVHATEIETGEIHSTRDEDAFDRLSAEIRNEAGNPPEDVLDHDE